ncbi:hypothetical protein [Streptomyces sp. NPDC058751]|uniref:hypothetical protein n=1 Tax=Streptomyces sp. NPDC058751 TaxID=3346623 RepID=UPI0036A38853
MTESCLVEAHGPSFRHLRDGQPITAFGFETPHYRTGEEPDLLLPALTAANLMGPGADLGRGDVEERIVEAISGFFSLPELEMPSPRALGGARCAVRADRPRFEGRTTGRHPGRQASSSCCQAVAAGNAWG